MYITITLVVYACVVWLASRCLRLASLPDRRFLSADKPDIDLAAIETTPPSTSDEHIAPAPLPALPAAETIVVPPYK
jgi:hypothetical protein